jgi:hypothetical protein
VSPAIKSKQPVTNLFAKSDAANKDILVSWNYPVIDDYRFIIYRVNGAGFMSYKSIRGNVTSFKDSDVKKGASYEYSVGVIYKDGRKAPFGKIVKTSF